MNKAKILEFTLLSIKLYLEFSGIDFGSKNASKQLGSFYTHVKKCTWIKTHPTKTFRICVSQQKSIVTRYVKC